MDRMNGSGDLWIYRWELGMGIFCQLIVLGLMGFFVFIALPGGKGMEGFVRTT